MAQLPTSESVLQSMLCQNVRFQAPLSEHKDSFTLSSLTMLETLPCDGTCIDTTAKSIAVGCTDGSVWVNGAITKNDIHAILDVSIQPMTGKVFYTTYHPDKELLELKCVGVDDPLFSIEHVDEEYPGGGICFDDENHLYFGVGSSSEQDVQDHRHLFGKILRIFAESADIPSDNPFASGPLRSIFRPEIFHSGVRNPKELVWDESLWVMDQGGLDGYQNIYCLEEPSNCRYGWYDGFRPMKDVTHVHESTFILPQATPHMSYQDPQINKSYYLDCLPEIGSKVVGGCLLANHAFLFADQDAGFLAFMPKREMGNVISQDNEITPITCKDAPSTITSIAGRGKEIVFLSRNQIYRALPREV